MNAACLSQWWGCQDAPGHIAQAFRTGAGATFIRQFLLPVLSGPRAQQGGTHYATEVVSDDEIERRLHDLTLDFGVVGSAAISRPLQTRGLGEWRLELWMPRALRLSEAAAARAFAGRRLPLALARKELEGLGARSAKEYEARLVCDSFLEARAAMEGQEVAALLPDFLAPGKAAKGFIRVHIPRIDSLGFHFYLAWNPRLLRLNPHAARRRDLLIQWLIEEVSANKENI